MSTNPPTPEEIVTLANGLVDDDMVSQTPEEVMLSILQNLQSDMQSMNDRVAACAQPGGRDERRLKPPVRTPIQQDAHNSVHNPYRWADHMDGLDVPMYDEMVFGEEGDEEEQENTATGAKLFAVSSRTESFLNTCFSGKAPNATRRQ